MKFVDEALIKISSGNGGAGAVSFMRQKFQPKMGPDGGNGGRGGHVYIEGTNSIQSLLDFRYKREFKADNGDGGASRDCDGKAAKDLIIRVPLGTLIKDSNSNIVIMDVKKEGKYLLAKGGRGGLGNMNFATPTRQAPDFAQPGEPGESLNILLELNLLADVALVGFPNVGKSTLISRISDAKPKIADYPFTTLVPNLGVVRGRDCDFTVADIPGLISGASQGKGLGIQFLKHINRCSLILMVLDLDPDIKLNLFEQYTMLLKELGEFSSQLANKQILIAINKCDLWGSDINSDLFTDYLEDRKFSKVKSLLQVEPIFISSVSGFGIDKLINSLSKDVIVKKQELAKELEVQVTPKRVLGNSRLFNQQSI